MNNSKQLEEARINLTGRLFTLGGSLLFFIGTLIVAVLAYQDYEELLKDQK